MITWVLEKNVFAEVCFDEMVAHFEEHGIPYHVVSVIPMLHEIEGRVPNIAGPCVVYGSIGAQKLAKRYGWSPGSFYDPDTFNYETYRDKLGDLLLNPDAVKLPISRLPKHIDDRGLMETEIFIKPNGDTKEFAGEVMLGEKFTPWYRGMIESGYLDGNDFDIVVASKKKLGCEWRVAVVDGKIIESSLYRQWQRVMPERHILPEVEEIIMQAHARFVPAPAYIVDVAQLYDDNGEYTFKVIEYNTLNSAGFYAMSPGPIIDAINVMLENA